MAQYCRSSYYTDTGRTQHPGDREIRCSLIAHVGHHAELDDDGEVLVIWPQRKAEPRVWSLPPEPGPEVTALRDGEGRRWERGSGQLARTWVYRHPDVGYVELSRLWPELVVGFGPLTDATAEVQR